MHGVPLLPFFLPEDVWVWKIFRLFKAPHCCVRPPWCVGCGTRGAGRPSVSFGIRLSTRHLATALSRLQAIGFIHQIQHLTLEVPPDQDRHFYFGFLTSFLSLRSLKLENKHL